MRACSPRRAPGVVSDPREESEPVLVGGFVDDVRHVAGGDSGVQDEPSAGHDGVAAEDLFVVGQAVVVKGVFERSQPCADSCVSSVALNRFACDLAACSHAVPRGPTEEPFAS